MSFWAVLAVEQCRDDAQNAEGLWLEPVEPVELHGFGPVIGEDTEMRIAAVRFAVK